MPKAVRKRKSGTGSCVGTCVGALRRCARRSAAGARRRKIARTIPVVRVRSQAECAPENIAFDRFFQNTDTGEALVDAFLSVAGNKHERDIALEQRLGDWINKLATEIDVQDRCFRRLPIQQPYRLCDTAADASDAQTKIFQLLLKNHRDQRLVFDHHDVAAGHPGRVHVCRPRHRQALRFTVSRARHRNRAAQAFGRQSNSVLPES